MSTYFDRLIARSGLRAPTTAVMPEPVVPIDVSSEVTTPEPSPPEPPTTRREPPSVAAAPLQPTPPAPAANVARPERAHRPADAADAGPSNPHVAAPHPGTQTTRVPRPTPVAGTNAAQRTVREADSRLAHSDVRPVDRGALAERPSTTPIPSRAPRSRVAAQGRAFVTAPARDAGGAPALQLHIGTIALTVRAPAPGGQPVAAPPPPAPQPPRFSASRHYLRWS